MEISLPKRLAQLLRALRFPTYWITGPQRYGEGELRILYAGSSPMCSYLNSIAFRASPSTEYLGKKTHLGLRRVAARLSPDLEFVRSHELLASSGLFSTWIFVPEWFAGHSDLQQQAEYEQQSRSRRRERNLLARNGVSFSVTTDSSALNFFYDEMYVPHVSSVHGEGALFMSKEQMFARVHDSSGELVVIQLRGKPVAGSFVVYEQGTPRLFSGGILGGDRGLFRLGVGSAIYLFTFDYLRGRGFAHVHMGRTRPFLSDGALYFKQRFGLTVGEVSEAGVLVRAGRNTPALADFLRNNGLIYCESGGVRAALLEPGSEKSAGRLLQLARRLGIKSIDNVRLSPDSTWQIHRTSNVRVAQDDS